MGSAEVKKTLEQYFLTNWTATAIQFDGVPFDYTGKTSWISLVYSSAANSTWAFDGSITGHVLREGVFKVFCYAKSPPLAFKLGDSIQSFLNEKKIGGVELGTGQDGSSNKLDNGYFEVPVTYFTKNFG